MKIILKLIMAIAIGAAAALFSNSDAPPAKLIVFIGVAAIVFFVIPIPKK
ncbi:MAG: hypothetical protein ACRDBO_05610 [Lachnospiraceae bacterium]